jgi:hypothetical protein
LPTKERRLPIEAKKAVAINKTLRPENCQSLREQMEDSMEHSHMWGEPWLGLAQVDGDLL